MNAVLECECLSKTFGRETLAEKVLEDVSLSLHRGEACVLLGPSGSGKTTLLSILGCLLTPSGGELRIQNQRVDFQSLSQLTALRRHHLGFVFQRPQLLPFLSLEENLRIVGKNAGLPEVDLTDRLDQILDTLGVSHLRHRMPTEASGGQCERVGVARALLHRPSVVLADEPTAALDWPCGEAVMRLLTQQARRENALLFVVTHDQRLVPMFDRVFSMVVGRIEEQ